MRTHVRKTAPLGELVVAAFKEAARYSTDPDEVSRLATKVVMRIVRRAGRLSSPAPISIMSLRRFIHVRYVSRTDLKRLAHRSHEVRAEVTAEVQKYLTSLG